MIKEACANYFHLIRHPFEAERKRSDKILTVVAYLSCITLIVPPLVGLFYGVSSLAGRIKQKYELSKTEEKTKEKSSVVTSQKNSESRTVSGSGAKSATEKESSPAASSHEDSESRTVTGSGAKSVEEKESGENPLSGIASEAVSSSEVDYDALQLDAYGKELLALCRKVRETEDLDQKAEAITQWRKVFLAEIAVSSIGNTLFGNRLVISNLRFSEKDVIAFSELVQFYKDQGKKLKLWISDSSNYEHQELDEGIRWYTRHLSTKDRNDYVWGFVGLCVQKKSVMDPIEVHGIPVVEFSSKFIFKEGAYNSFHCDITSDESIYANCFENLKKINSETQSKSLNDIKRPEFSLETLLYLFEVAESAQNEVEKMEAIKNWAKYFVETRVETHDDLLFDYLIKDNYFATEFYMKQFTKLLKHNSNHRFYMLPLHIPLHNYSTIYPDVGMHRQFLRDIGGDQFAWIGLSAPANIKHNAHLALIDEDKNGIPTERWPAIALVRQDGRLMEHLIEQDVNSIINGQWKSEFEDQNERIRR